MPDTATEEAINQKLGLGKLVGQYAQLGAVGAIILGFGFLLFWVRNDAKEQLRQQSVERAEDRELRKELAVIQASSMEKLSAAIGDFRLELRERDIKLSSALEKLTNKIDKMP